MLKLFSILLALAPFAATAAEPTKNESLGIVYHKDNHTVIYDDMNSKVLASAGLIKGDELLEACGLKTSDGNSYAGALRKLIASDSCELKLVRNGKPLNLTYRKVEQ